MFFRPFLVLFLPGLSLLLDGNHILEVKSLVQHLVVLPKVDWTSVHFSTTANTVRFLKKVCVDYFLFNLSCNCSQKSANRKTSPETGLTHGTWPS